MRVTLSWYELALAARVGESRHLRALASGRPDCHGFSGQGWSEHIEGAAGEMAAAKAMGRYWSGSVDTFKCGGDVGAIQVRTRSRPDYELLVRPTDRDGDAFVLVRGRAPEFEVVGWLRGSEAKRPEWWREYGGRPGAWFVPDASLRAIEALAMRAA